MHIRIHTYYHMKTFSFASAARNRRTNIVCMECMYGVCVWYVLCIFAVSSESAYHSGRVQFIGDDGLLQPVRLLKYIHISGVRVT